MITHFITASFRSVLKNISNTSINLAGLTLGITCSIIIYQIVTFELSFDKYNTHANQTYRIVTAYLEEEAAFNSGTTYPLPPALRNDFPDLENVVLVDANIGDVVISVSQPDGSVRRFKEDQVCFADEGYFDLFDHTWIEGGADPLTREKTVAISYSVARKYFGDTSPMNKIINYNNQFDVTVTGVFQDPPLNSSLRFLMVFSSKLGADERGWKDWGSTSSGLNCFIKLHNGISQKQFEDKLAGWHFKYFTGEDEDDGKNLRYFLQPLTEMHYDTRFTLFHGPTKSYTTLLTLASIGVLLFLTASANFINLNTVLIAARSKEVGIRKALGSTRLSIALQFIAETLVLAMFALAISMALVPIALQALQPVLGYALNFNPFGDIKTALFLVLLPFGIAILAGLYPAIRLAKFQPSQVLKTRLLSGSGDAINLRRTLVVFQLIVTQALIVSTIIIVQQMQHFSSEPLGLTSNAVVEFDVPENELQTLRSLRTRLLQATGVESTTFSNTGSISANTWNSSFKASIRGAVIEESTQVKFADDAFIDTYGIRVVEGKNIIRSDTATGFLVNEKFVQLLGISNSEAIGLPIEIWGKKASIQGVVNDFHTRSLHRSLVPVLIMSNNQFYQQGAVRFTSAITHEAIAALKKAWDETFPGYVFEYHYLDDNIAEFYEVERHNAYLIGLFAAVAVLVAAIGLYGLISYLASNRVKEIGIRKTLGSSTVQIMTLLSKEFVMLTVIAFIISSPAIYYLAENWLSNFAYRIYPGALTFLTGMSLVTVIVLGTISLRSYRAASANHVDALRSE